MTWLLVFYLATGAEITYRHSFPSRAPRDGAPPGP